MWKEHDIIDLFEDLRSANGNAGAEGATHEGRALREVLDEIDDIARATLGSFTIETMLKLIERRRAGEAPAGKRIRAAAP